MNDEAFLLDIIRTYIEEDKRAVLEEEYTEESWKDYQVHIHALKSTSLNIGAEALSDHAKALESAVQTADYPYILAHHAEVMMEYEKLLEELRHNI